MKCQIKYGRPAVLAVGSLGSEWGRPATVVGNNREEEEEEIG